MGGFIAPSTTIGGSVLAPGIPLAASPQSGLFQTTNGIGIAISQQQFFAINSAGFFYGYSPVGASSLVNAVGSPFAAGGNNPTASAINPAGTFVAVSNNQSASVNIYTLINSTLTPVPGSPFACGANPTSVAFSPDGRQLMTANYGAANISVFDVNQSTGALTQMAGSPFAVGLNPYQAVFSLDGKCVLVTNSGAGTVTSFTRNTSTGALAAAAGSPFATGAGCVAVRISPNGAFAYVANSTPNTVSAYTINTATGALTPIAGSPFAAGLTPYGMDISPDSKNLYVTNNGAGTISAYNIADGTGVLSGVAGSPFACGTSPSAAVLSLDGLSVYVNSQNTAKLYEYRRSLTTGVLTALSSSPVTAGTTPSYLTITPDNLRVIVPNSGGNNVSVFELVSSAGYSLVKAQFDPAYGPAGVLNVNGVLQVLGVAVPSLVSNDARYQQLLGITSGGAVPAGQIGEIITSSVAQGAAVNLTTTVVANMTSLALTAGVWDVQVSAAYHSATGTTVAADVKQGVSLVSAVMGAIGTYTYDYLGLALSAADDPVYPSQTVRVNIAAPTTVYGVVMADFSVSTLTAYGFMRATRVA